MKFKPICKLVEESVKFGDVEVLKIAYDVTSADRLVILLESNTMGQFNLVFESPEAIRILDEGQICEFWDIYSSPNGWLWQVNAGGWTELESLRDDFWLKDSATHELREYLIVGDQCVFVLTQNPPAFESSINSSLD